MSQVFHAFFFSILKIKTNVSTLDFATFSNILEQVFQQEYG